MSQEPRESSLPHTPLKFATPDRGRPDPRHTLAICTAALKREDTPAAILLKLGRDLESARWHTSALKAYIAAFEKDPNSPEVLMRLSRLLHRLGRFERAAHHCDRFLTQKPSSLTGRMLKSELQWALGREAEAVSLLENLRESERNPWVLERLGRWKLALGEPLECLTLCEQLLRSDPRSTGGLALKVAALYALSRPDEARYLLGRDSFFWSGLARLPESPFLADLAKELGCVRSLVTDPAGLTTRGGRQSGPLTASDGPLVSQVLKLISVQVDSRIQELARGSSHSWLDARPSEPQLVAWTVILGNGGQQEAHIHEDAWMSGVLFVQVPPSDDGAGAIEFGRPPGGFSEYGESFRLMPEPGQIVLFPSFYFHSTVPTRSGLERISIAFDVK